MYRNNYHLHFIIHSLKEHTRISGWQRFLLYHRFFRSSGFYRFFLRNLIKVILIIGLVIGSVLVLERYLLHDLRENFVGWLHNLPHLGVWVVYSISETLLGLIPPDLFIIWSSKFGQPFLYLTLLGAVSYLAGFLSYFIGRYFGRKRRVERWLMGKYGKFVKQLRQWGGLLVIVAALLPLPYSAVCMISGLIKYPFSKLALYGISRILRYYLYALFLFEIF